MFTLTVYNVFDRWMQSFSCLHSPTYFFWSAVDCLTGSQASAEKNYVHTTEAVVGCKCLSYDDRVYVMCMYVVRMICIYMAKVNNASNNAYTSLRKTRKLYIGTIYYSNVRILSL